MSYSQMWEMSVYEKRRERQVVGRQEEFSHRPSGDGTSSEMPSFKMLDLCTEDDFISIQSIFFFLVCFCLKSYRKINL